jgi:hypothetical protein
VPVAALVVGVADLDLVLDLEADAIAALTMRVEAGDGREAASVRVDLNRRALLFAELFDRWRETEGLDEGGTWPIKSRSCPSKFGLNKPIFPPLSVSRERCAPISAIFCR